MALDFRYELYYATQNTVPHIKVHGFTVHAVCVINTV